MSSTRDLKKGKLIPSEFGFSQPVDAPLYSKLPMFFPNSEIISIRYETDEDAVAGILPEGLEVDSPSIAVFTLFNFTFSTIGAYKEAALDVACRWKGEPKMYTAYNLVTNDSGLAAGREIWGVPKKQAHIEFMKEFDLVMGLIERPSGNRICTALIRAVERADLSNVKAVSRLCLRVIPPVEEGKGPSLAELVDRCGHRMVPKDVWQGPGSLVYGQSEIDPWYRIKVRKILNCFYGHYDYTLDFGKILKRYG
jgi:acetoacetate decarboxylase